MQILTDRKDDLFTRQGMLHAGGELTEEAYTISPEMEGVAFRNPIHYLTPEIGERLRVE